MKKSKELYHLPTTEDRECAATAIEYFLNLQNASARILMLRILKQLLNKYHLSKLFLPNCIVENCPQGFVSIKSIRFIKQDNCPSCGEDIYSKDSKVRILSIYEGKEAHIVTYGCHCGEIFGKMEIIHSEDLTF